MQRYSDMPEPPLDPPAEPEYCFCAHCMGEVYTDTYIYNGEIVCKDCYEEAYDIETVVKFIEAYPYGFLDYLKEGCIDNPKVLSMLEEYRDWQKDEYDKWVLS